MKEISAFIVGFTRSGTTLLRVMLNANSKICVTQESRFIYELYNKFKKGINNELDLNLFLDELYKDNLFAHWSIKREELYYILNKKQKLNYKRAVLEIYNYYLIKNNYDKKTLIIDKNPAYIYHINFLHNLFPKSKIIHIIRDGRAAFVSNRKAYLKNKPFSGNAVGLALKWNKAMKNGLLYKKESYFYTLKYENLLLNPKKELDKICNFLKIDFDYKMLEYYKVNLKKDFIPDDVKGHHQLTYKKIDISRIDTWQVETDKVLINIFNLFAKKYLKILNYPDLNKNLQISRFYLSIYLVIYLFATFLQKLGLKNNNFIKKILKI